MSDQHVTEDQLSALRSGFAQRLPEHLSDIIMLLEIITDTDASSLPTLQRKAHALASAANTFGASKISLAAHSLALAIKSMLDSDALPSSTLIKQQLTEYVSTLHHYIVTYDHQTTNNNTTTPRPDDDKNLLIYSAIHKPSQASDVSYAITAAGHRCNTYDDINTFAQDFETRKPDAVIMDITFGEGQEICGHQFVRQHIREQGLEIPVVFTSEYGDIETRLNAVRAGGRRFLTYPLDFSDLIQSIGGLTAHTPTIPYRVLIIDDDKDIADFHTAILNAAGCETRILEDPMQTLSALKAFKPDLLLLDVNMPSCDGLELAALIRQDNNLSQAPIVFLSSEQRLWRQQDAMELGGDDFITKPVDPERLLSVVTTRIRRHRRIDRLTNDLRKALRENQYQQVAIDKHAIVSITDPKGVITYVNENFCRISHYRSEELLGSNHRIIKSGQHPAEFYREMWQTIARGKVWQGEVCNRDKMGQFYWVESTIVPFIDDHGRPYQYVSIRTDITQIKRIENQLRSVNDRMDYLLSSSPVIIYSLKLEDNMFHPAWSSKNIEHLLGYTPQEVAEKDWWYRNVHPDDLQSALEKNQLLLTDGHLQHEYRFRQKNGGYVWIHDQMSLQCNALDHTSEIIGAWTDITALRTVQQILMDNEERLRRSQEYANIGTWDWNIGTGELIWSERIGPLFGYEAGKLETTYENFLNAIHPDDRQLVINAVTDCIENGIEYNIEHRCVWPDGSIHWLLERGDVVRDSEGTPTHMLGVVQDVTVRKHAELDLLTAKEEAVQANQAKSQFLSSMSHELRTPLNAILGFAQLLEMDADQLTEDHQEDVQEIISAGRHLLELINEVLDLAKIEAGRIELNISDLDAEPILRECQSLIKPLLTKFKISRFEYHLPEQPINIHADRTRLKQILLNLISNAIKYNRPNGTIDIETSFINNHLRIAVRDSGEGIPNDKLSQLFQPFKRLVGKEASIEGTGIGLVITRELTELMGGAIGVESEVGIGSCFWVELPATLRTHSLDDSQECCRILYVDDDPGNTRQITRLLSGRNDIELHTTSVPSHAIQLANDIEPNLILCNLQLREIDGYQLFDQFQQQTGSRNTPVIAICTDTLPGTHTSVLNYGFRDVILKPIDPQQVLTSINTILNLEPSQ